MTGAALHEDGRRHALEPRRPHLDVVLRAEAPGLDVAEHRLDTALVDCLRYRDSLEQFRPAAQRVHTVLNRTERLYTHRVLGLEGDGGDALERGHRLLLRG